MSAPTTQFEDSGGTEWTTIANEQLFLDEVVSDSGRATKVLVGHSFDGHPIYAVAVGITAPTWGDISDAYLVVASQHGYEETPREAALQVIRNLAYTTAPDEETWLTDNVAVFIPTANPDGTIANTRENGAGADINRDHIALAQPEGRAIARTIMATSPMFIYDGHETGTGPLQINTAYFGPGADKAIKDYAVSILAEVDILFSSYTRAAYNLANHEGTLTHSAALRGIPNILLEPLTSQSALTKCAQHVTGMTGMFGFCADNREAVLGVRDAARAHYRLEGYAAHAAYYGYESGAIPAAWGYRLPPGVLATNLQLLGIQSHPFADSLGNGYVSMAQEAAPLIPLLMDPAAPRFVYAAEPVMDGPGFDSGAKSTPHTLTEYRARLGGRSLRARDVVMRLGGSRFHVWGS